MSKLLIIISLLNITLQHGHHFPRGVPPPPPTGFLDKMREKLNDWFHSPELNNLRQAQDENLKKLFDKFRMPPKVLDNFKDRLTKSKEMVQIQLNYDKLQQQHQESKKALKDINNKLLMVVNFNMIILGFIKNNQKIFKSIENFRGHFVIKAKESEVPQIMHDFLQKLIEIQQKQSVTHQMAQEIAQNVEKLKDHKQSLEDLQKIHEENMKLIQEKIQEFKNIFKDVVDAIKDIENKYGPEVPDQPENKIQNAVENEKKADDKDLNDFDERLKKLESISENNSKKLDEILKRQREIQDMQNKMKDKIDNTKIIEDGLDEVQRIHNQDASNLLNDIDNLKNSPAAQDFIKQLEDLANAFKPSQE
jgi:hypothetical protein